MINNRYLLIPALLIFAAGGIYAYLRAQQPQELNLLSFEHLNVYYSGTDTARAQKIGSRTNRAISFFNQVFEINPSVRLLVLSDEDWKQYTKMPVYGMPHYTNGALIVASDENEFWTGFLPPMDQLPSKQLELVKKTYGDEKGNISMKKFFDLVAIHELAHAYHMQGDLNMQRKWLQELFANATMYAYTAEKEPELIPVIDVFSNMVVNAGTEGFSYVSLQEFENNYEKIASQAPKNYGWYQSKLNLFAKKIYEKGGVEMLQKLWNALKKENQPINDAQLHTLLQGTLGDQLANELAAW